MSETDRTLAELQETIGYTFRHTSWLERALTHSSYAKGSAATDGEDNEQLELLGDAVLGLIVTRALLQRFPDWSVGRHSQARSQLVNARSLHETGMRLNLGQYLRVGRGEEKAGLREQRDVIADAYEALVAAIYTDGGFEASEEFVTRSLLETSLREQGETLGRLDQKSALMEWFQARGKRLPEYRVVAESGPDHRKLFVVEVQTEGQTLASGEGTSKKAAELAAAGQALQVLRDA